MHAGAMLPVPAGRSVVGSAPDCDILLADPGVAPHHLELLIDGGAVCARRIDDAEVRVNGKAVRGQRVILSVGTPVQVGDCTLELTSAQEGDADGKPTGGRRLVLVTVVVATSALLAVLVGGSLLDTRAAGEVSGHEQGRDTMSQAQVFQRDIADLKIATLAVQSTGPDEFTLTGFVDDQDQARRVNSIIREATRVRVRSSLVVGSQVADWIRDSLASPELTVRYIGNGVVTIEGEIEGQAFRTRLSQVHQQFAKLVRIQDRTRPSTKPPPAPSSDAPRPKSIAALQVLPVGVTPSGRTLYVVSDGRQRFMAGATLPDGRVIESIGPSTIVVRNATGVLEEVRP
jgi:hypothetical protein